MVRKHSNDTLLVQASTKPAWCEISKICDNSVRGLVCKWMDPRAHRGDANSQHTETRINMQRTHGYSFHGSTIPYACGDISA